MGREIKPPVVVAEGNDVFVYRSIADVRTAIEAIDVDDGVYRVWDASGCVLSLSAEPPHGRAWDRPVHVSLDADATDGSSDLAALLVELLRSAGIPARASEGIEVLINRFVVWQGYSR